MTRPPQPAPYPGDPGVGKLEGRVRYRRTYTDILDRPMFGKVTVINRARLTPGQSTVVPPSSVSVDVTDGVLELWLPPGVYQLKAQLQTVDRTGTFVDDDTITVGEESP